MNKWEGTTAIVTGGGSGIGRALAKELSKRGVFVVIADINPEAAQAVAKECSPHSLAKVLNVSEASSVRNCIETIFKERGRLDYLFNNAGIGISGETYEIPLQAWDRIIDINIRGVIHGIIAAYPLMVKQGKGHIINTASLAGLGPAPLLTPYAMTKHAVVGISTSLRNEASALGVRVSVLCPSAIETPLLDSENPLDLPKISWHPNIRRFLTQLAGPPYSAEKFAVTALDAISRNVGVIVLPGRAKLIWRLGRFFPWLAEKACISAVAKERATKGQS